MKRKSDIFQIIHSSVSAVKKRYGVIPFQLMDWTVILYLAVIGVLVIPFHRDVRHWMVFPPAHAGIIVLLLEFLRWSRDRNQAVIRFLRMFYPALGVPFLWSELDSLITMILPYWANDWVIRLDLRLFGVHPTVWVEQWFRPWLTELMNFFYAFYYLSFPLVGLTLYLRGKRQQVFDFLFLVMLTFCSSYLLFLLFPAEGAWVVLKELHSIQPEGGLFLHIVQFIQSKGTIRGGAFPSSHVSAAFVVSLAAIRYIRKPGYFLLPFAFGVAAATVYCRYHHAVDALSGILWGVICYGAGVRILKWRDRKARL